MTRRQSPPMLALPVFAMCFAALLPVRAVAQETRQTEPAASADSLYCEQRRLGYWFYCIKPVPAEEPQMAQPPAQVTATQELDAVTEELRELKDKPAPWGLDQKRWAGQVTHMDRSVGVLLDELKSQGLDENTLVISRPHLVVESSTLARQIGDRQTDKRSRLGVRTWHLQET
mgnify:CR=1 FL=1